MQKKFLLIVLLVLPFFVPFTVVGQEGEISANPLTMLQPVRGLISTAQPDQRWTFTAIAGQRVSLRLQTQSGNLNPYMEMMDETGNVLITSQNSSFRHATVDYFAAEKDATYTVRATSVPNTNTEGEYTLVLLPGYSFLALNDPIDANTPLRLWREANALSQLANGRLRLQAEDHYAWTMANRLGAYQDIYIQTEVQIEQSTGYWEQGLLVRGRQRTDGTDEFYAFFINSNKQWRFGLSQFNGLFLIQDWTDFTADLTDPATIGLMAEGDIFTFFYNNRVIGSAKDSSLGQAGFVGLIVGTGTALENPGNTVSLLFDNVIITLPAIDGTTPLAIPQTLKNWQGTRTEILTELRESQVIPSDGRLAIDLASPFVNNNTNGGIVFIPLARNATFTNMIYVADVQWISDSENIACGMEFRAANSKNFSIFYFDRKGGYGIRQENETDGVLINIYDLSDAIIKDNEASNRVIIIAVGNGLLVYVNGELLINMNVKQSTGNVYIAAFNYEKASTFCGFNNLWLRSFD